MRIYTKLSPMFKNPDPLIKDEDVRKYIRCSPGFHDVPDWVKKDITFISGIKSGVIELIEAKASVSVPDQEEKKGNKK